MHLVEIKKKVVSSHILSSISLLVLGSFGVARSKVAGQ